MIRQITGFTIGGSEIKWGRENPAFISLALSSQQWQGEFIFKGTGIN
jgi:hypothetical protein